MKLYQVDTDVNSGGHKLLKFIVISHCEESYVIQTEDRSRVFSIESDLVCDGSTTGNDQSYFTSIDLAVAEIRERFSDERLEHSRSNHLWISAANAKAKNFLED